MKPNPIRGFEEAMIVLALGIVLIVLTADFFNAFLSGHLPGELALLRRIGYWVVVPRNLINTWPCFAVGMLCGLALSRRAAIYAASAAAPTAFWPLLSAGIASMTVTYALCAMAYALLGATLGLRFAHTRRIPASVVPAETSVGFLAVRLVASFAVFVTTLAWTAVFHNVVSGRIGQHTISAFVLFSVMLAGVVALRLSLRSPAPARAPIEGASIEPMEIKAGGC